MLSRRHAGFTLVEMVVAIAIVAMLLMMGAPSFATWYQNLQIRGAADSVQNGIALARAQAVQRNAPVSFQLVNSLDNSCALLSTGTATRASNWVVSMDPAAGSCAAATNETMTDTTPAPHMIQKRAGSDGSSNATLTVTGASLMTFNGLGRLTTTATTIDVTNPTGGACQSASGPMRCLRVTVSAAGQVRLCDPKFTAATDPQGC
jgi:type IV fimbrial biogenesis protein FimT